MKVQRVGVERPAAAVAARGPSGDPSPSVSPDTPRPPPSRRQSFEFELLATRLYHLCFHLAFDLCRSPPPKSTMPPLPWAGEMHRPILAKKKNHQDFPLFEPDKIKGIDLVNGFKN